MKRLFFSVLLLLGLAAAAWAAGPASDARFLEIDIQYRLQADGSWDMEYRHQVRLDTYFAVNRALGETFIVINPEFQKLEILKSETTMANGRKVASPDNAFNEVLPFAAHEFADFAHLREMVVTHTGLERGALVDLHYRIHTRPGLLPVFSGREALNRNFPIDRYRLAITVPAGSELRAQVFNAPARVEASGSGAERCHALELKAIAAAAHEPLAPAQAEPFIIFSCAADWTQALAWKDGPAVLPAAPAAMVDRLKNEFPAQSDLLAALQRAVAVDMRLCALGSDKAGWQPRPLERVFTSHYGTRLEKALLLRAMLEHAGISADLLGVAGGGSFSADVPTPLQLDEFWLAVGEGPHRLFLDPGHEQHEFFPYERTGAAAYNFRRREMEQMPPADWNRNGVDIAGTVQLDAAAASGTLVVTVRGAFQRYNEAAENGGAFISGLLRKIFPLEKAEIKKLLALTRREMRAEVTFSGKWLKETGAGFHRVEACRLPGLDENMVQLPQRELPLALAAPFKVSIELELRPAPGLSLDYSAPDVEVTNETGYFVRRHEKQKNGPIRFSQTCAIKDTPVPAAWYPRLRELLRPCFTPGSWLVFREGK
jgi:hypothetical protein